MTPTIVALPEHPLRILAMKTLTLPDVTAEDRASIKSAAGREATLTVVDSPRDAIAHAPDVDVVLGITGRSFVAAAPDLRWVHATASGIDMFMFDEFVESDIVLTGEKGLVGGHLADTGFALLLALTRRVAMAVELGPDGWSDENRKRMRYSELELEGLTMGILGFGGTGRHLARRAVAFGMDVLAVDAHPVPPSDGVREVWGLERIDEVVAASDVVAVGLPLTEETRAMCNDDFFARMKDTAILLNVTRGEIMDGPALERALIEGTIGGACLDVAPVEPLPADSPLWDLDNCVMTPHTAGASQHRARRSLERFCRNLEAMRAGEPMEGVVDKRAGF